MNQQREVIYGYRNEVLQSEDPRSLINEVIEEAVPARVETFVGFEDPDIEKDYDGLLNWGEFDFPSGAEAKGDRF